MVNINIPLPASCASCPLSVRHFGKLYCPPLNDRVGNEGKDSRCPLVDAGDQFAEVSKKGDLISRHALLRQIEIDADGEPGYYGDTWKFIDTIKMMPSAQPEIIRCKDCKYCEHWYADKGRCFLWHEDGIDVFGDGFCNYAERRTDE